jgi:hypothetical protein
MGKKALEVEFRHQDCRDTPCSEHSLGNFLTAYGQAHATFGIAWRSVAKSHLEAGICVVRLCLFQVFRAGQTDSSASDDRQISISEECGWPASKRPTETVSGGHASSASAVVARAAPNGSTASPARRSDLGLFLEL